MEKDTTEQQLIAAKSAILRLCAAFDDLISNGIIPKDPGDRIRGSVIEARRLCDKLPVGEIRLL